MSVFDFKELRNEAKEKLSKNIFAYVDSGAESEKTKERNYKSLNEYFIIPRVLRNVIVPNTELQLLNFSLKSPMLIAPMAYQSLLHKYGELETIKAVNKFGGGLILSIFSSTDFKKIVDNANQKPWFQLYFLKDREITKNIIQAISRMGFQALVITVDTPIYGKKTQEKQTPLFLPNYISFDHLNHFGIDVNKIRKLPNHFASLLDSTISWEDIEWVSKITNLPIILKGILDPRDTQIALKFPNIKGIIISNHGGRQLDSVISPLDTIRQHRQLVEDKLFLGIDGGITTGKDVFKSIALGADVVFLGRIILWTLTVFGSKGVSQLLNHLKNELEETMFLTGCGKLSDISTVELLRFMKV